jgi:hypothetical protein
MSDAADKVMEALEGKPELLGEIRERLGCADKGRIEKAIDFAVRYGGIDGGHHKMWVIDQMVRALTGCPMVEREAKDYKGDPYTYEDQGESREYLDLVADACDGEDGPNTYSWDEGTPP